MRIHLYKPKSCDFIEGTEIKKLKFLWFPRLLPYGNWTVLWLEWVTDEYMKDFLTGKFRKVSTTFHGKKKP